ncbi:TraB/TrbI/VirB10 family type IV secretion system protein [Burkholderia cenocepacia]|uniref:TrbI/VirB10 family protein n=1 Tax=Burkholderia cenocepacia TaxID=95486 RepID=UPI0013E02681|nr:TrbI/VirB10 family protein [Burkholderia cenocepacia]MCW3587405.1 TrbI/VirB10 family protein [Burkholderia cenocepacia]MCW3632609.1 TrbI/VirB10 family protein [Burkholderia cenocepacia]MCW5181840.1 TrbI/VirB10 family protein [Burkholderia cenocepacia]
MSEIKQQPSFDSAPQHGSGIVGSLKGAPANYKRLNPKVKNIIIFGAAGIVALILFAILNIDDNPQPVKKKEEKAAQTRMEGSVPKGLADAPNGVPGAGAGNPSAADAGIPAGGAAGAGGASALATGNQGRPVGAADDLAGAGRVGGVPPVGGAYPDHPPPREKTPAEMAAERRALDREEALKKGAESGLTGQQQDAGVGAGLPTRPQVPDAAAMLGGGSSGANQVPGLVPSSEDPNKQIRKEQFLKEASAVSQLSNTLLQTVQPPLSPYTINAGWLIPASMVGGMKSDLPGELKAQVRENVKDSVSGRYVLIPRGSTLLGKYDSQIAFGQSRVLVVWSRVIFPDGSSLNLQGMPAQDEQGYAGLTGDVDNHMWPIIKAAVFMSVISAGAQLSQPQSSNSNGSYGAPNAGQQLAAALGQQLGQAGTQLFSRYLAIQPTITTEPGTKFNILVTKDMVFPKPWSWSN